MSTPPDNLANRQAIEQLPKKQANQAYLNS